MIAPPLPNRKRIIGRGGLNIEVQTVVLDGIDRRPVPAEILRELDDRGPGVVEPRVACADDRLVPNAIGKTKAASPVAKASS